MLCKHTHRHKQLHYFMVAGDKNSSMRDFICTKIWTWHSQKSISTFSRSYFVLLPDRFRTWCFTAPEEKFKTNHKTTIPYELVSLLNLIKPTVGRNTVPAGLKWAGESSYNRCCWSSKAPLTGWILAPDWMICGLHHSRKIHPLAWKIQSIQVGFSGKLMWMLREV